MSRVSRITLWCAAIGIVLALILPSSRTAVAGGPQCLPTGQVVKGDTTGMEVEPCPQPAEENEREENDTSEDRESEPPPRNFSTIYWGYEASFFSPSRLNAYRAVISPVPSNQLVASCVPTGPDIPAVSNGRGVAFDPLDGDLWISRLTGFGLPGDNRITKIPPPPPSDITWTWTQVPCQEVTSLFVHFPDGSSPQQFGFGALDTDTSKHIWAAGTPPVSVNGQLRNYFYEVNRHNGLIIHSCFLEAPSPFDGNDSLTFARLSGLPGSGHYLLTDNGSFEPTLPLLVIDVTSCHNGNQATPVASFPNPGQDPGPHFGTGVSGIDLAGFGLLNTDTQSSYLNSGTPPFAASTLLGPDGAVVGLEDIAACGFRVKMDWDGNDFDFCPFQ